MLIPNDQQLAYRRQVRDAILDLARVIEPEMSGTPALATQQVSATQRLAQLTNSSDIAHGVAEALLMLYLRRHDHLLHDAATIEFDTLRAE